MKKRVFLLLLCLALIVCALASCDNGETPAGESEATNPPSGEKGHVHTYSETLSKDAEGHWYEATCECADVEAKKAAHVDANNDGACDICTFTDHEHVYDTENWTVDCTNHWHAAICDHVVAGIDVAAHADTDEDGKCDVCKYVIEDIHTHVFATEWTSDAQNHWHAALCEHKAEISGKEGHNIDARGFCTVCGAKVKDVDETKIEEVLAAAAANRDSITRGNVEYKYIMDGRQYHHDKILYVLGPKSTFRQVTNQIGSEYEDYIMQWYELLGTNAEGEDEIFGVQSKDGVNIEAVMGTSELLNGFYYNAGSVVDGKSLEEFLTVIYSLTANNDINAVIIPDPANPVTGDHSYASNVVITHDADENTYAFSFDYLVVNVNRLGGDGYSIVPSLYKFDVEFVYNDRFVIIEASVNVDGYQDGQRALGDVDFAYDMATGTFEMLAGANSDTYNFYTVQVEGERNYNTIYPKDSFIPTDFDIFTDAGCTDEVEAEETVYYLEYTKFYLGNLFPVTSSLDYLDAEDINVTITDAQGNEVDWFVTTPSAIVPYLAFMPNVTEGTYTVTITYRKAVKTFNINVEIPDASGVNAYGFTYVQGYDAPVLTVDETTMMTTKRVAVGETFDFVVKVDPRGALQGYTYTTSNATTINEIDVTDCVIFGESYGEDSETGEIKYAKVLQFVSLVDGTYEIVFTSEDGKATGTLTVVVGNGGGAENLPTGVSFSFETPGKYTSSAWQTFTAPKSGTYVITAEGLQDVTRLYINRPDGNGSDNSRIEGALPYSIELAEGEELGIKITGWSNEATVVGTTVTVTIDLASDTPEVDPYNFELSATLTQDDIDNWNSAKVTFTVTEFGCYTFTNAENLYLNVWNSPYNEDESAIGSGSVLLTPGTYVLTCAAFDEQPAGTYTIEVNGCAFEDMTEDVIKALFRMKEFTVGDYSIGFYGNDEYDVNIWNGNTFNPDQYYTYTTTVEGDSVIFHLTWVDYSFASGENMLSDEATLVATYDNGEWTLTCEELSNGNVGGGDDEEEDDDTVEMITGVSYIGTDYWENSPLTVVFDMTNNKVGFYYSHPMQGDSSIVGDYVVIDGVMHIYDAEGVEFGRYVAAVTLTDGVPTNATYNGSSYTLSGEGFVATENGGDDEEDDDDQQGGGIVYDAPLALGANTLYFSADEDAANVATRTLVVDVAGDYKFASNNLFITGVVDADGNALVKNSNYSYTLAAGTYTITINIGMFSIPADTACSLNITAPN